MKYDNDTLDDLCIYYLFTIQKGYIIDDSQQAAIHQAIANKLCISFKNAELKEILSNLDFWIFLDYRMPYDDYELDQKGRRLARLLRTRFPSQIHPQR